MARQLFTAAQQQAANYLLAAIASGQNPDGTKFSLAVEGGIADSVIAAGVTTAPGAGAALATIASGSLPAGVYEVLVEVSVSGNAVADLNNVKLQRGGVDLVPILPQGGSGNSGDLRIPRCLLDGTQALTVVAIGAGTAAIEYGVSITATRVE